MSDRVAPPRRPLMPPGTAIPLHRHERHEEALYLHRGQVTVTLGTRRVVAEAGPLVYIPAATWIGVENTGGATASVVGIVAERTRCASSGTAR